MQNPAIVKEICNVPGEISILHNRSSPSDNICGLTISILFFRSTVNETNYEEILNMPPALRSRGQRCQYFRDSRASASSRVIWPALHEAMICTSLSLSL